MPELVPVEIPPSTVMLKGLDWDSNIYLVRSGREALIVDTGTGKRVRDYIGLLAGEGYLDGLRKVVVFNTHEHFDHIGGNLAFKSLLEGLGIKVSFAAHRIVAEVIERGLSRIILDYAYGERFKPHEVHAKLEDGDELKVGKLRLKVVHTPGHTAGSTCLYLDGETKLMFTGDTVFNGTVGRTDLPTGSGEELRKSLERLAGFEVDFGLPGHGWVIKDWKGNLKRVMP
ncbi:MBL fold metallo-hydrolase [Thermococcus sp.]|uniref:MBL fold metallo-hydrolase n=1 Tax=Thermococcus sp. TaxID=35749 RepID=UPI00261EB8F2|nr:MBL fold metallo-hydrolase [Thermococcus sp.]